MLFSSVSLVLRIDSTLEALDIFPLPIDQSFADEIIFRSFLFLNIYTANLFVDWIFKGGVGGFIGAISAFMLSYAYSHCRIYEFII